MPHRAHKCLFAVLSALALAILLTPPPAPAQITTTGNITPWPAGPGDNLVLDGDATMTIAGSGQLGQSSFTTLTTAAGTVGVTENGGPFAAVTVSNGAWLMTGRLCLANGSLTDGARGSLLVQNNGVVSDGSAIIGANSNDAYATATVTTGSAWYNAGFLAVAGDGSGTLTINTGGLVTSAGANIGGDAIQSGSAIVSGPGSTWLNAGELDVNRGGDSVGALQIDSGAVVASGSCTIWGGAVGKYVFGTATILGAGSQLSLTSTFNTLSGALVEVGDGAIVHAGGSVNIGPPPDGPGGTLHFLIGPSGSGRLETDSDLVLENSAQLLVTVDPSVTLSYGQSFDLMEWQGQLEGEFGNVELPTLSAGLSWDTSDLYTDGTISIVPEPATVSLLLLGAVILLVRRRRIR